MHPKAARGRADFSLFNHPSPVIYLDNACQTLRPAQVVSAELAYLEQYPACAGRSNHHLAARVQEEVTASRESLRRFLGAKNSSEIIFTRNTTEGINLLASSLEWRKGDVVIISDKEHNSNLIPWQRLRDQGKIKFLVHRSLPDNTFDLEGLQKLLAKTKNVRLLSFALTSNLDGVSVPDKAIVKLAHQHGVLVHFDGAQAIPHRSLNVRALDVDFLSFSGHKMLGPSGMGVFYGKKALLAQLPPFLVGGDTVSTTTYQTATYLDAPEKFEAGLQNYSGIIGLGIAAEYLMKYGFAKIAQTELALNKIVTAGTADIEGLQIIGPPDPRLRGGIFSFYIPSIDHHQIALLLDKTAQIAVRSGQHCVHSWFHERGISGSVRASFYLYNTPKEAQQFVDALKKIVNILR
ncbi:aminotransferase class V-fold PLP-dependent enzyme [Microgenomates group bacterium]|nr:aminotransferase class V-fold PLP-dependent enzyme [Microgenomates group bacterium]